MAKQIQIKMLKDITPPGWTSTFHVGTSTFYYDGGNLRAKKSHMLIFQRGPNYGSVGDMCASFTHEELLQLERDGFVKIERG